MANTYWLNQGCFNVHNEWQTLIDLIKVVLIKVMIMLEKSKKLKKVQCSYFTDAHIYIHIGFNLKMFHKLLHLNSW